MKLGRLVNAATVSLALMFSASANANGVVVLTQDDFVHGTYIIDKPGKYRLGEDISFNPNSVETLNAMCDDGSPLLPPGFSCPFDAWNAGSPFPTQYIPGGVSDFTPGSPLDARYDPAGFGLGFFAAIVIAADGVDLNLAGHTIEQSAEHALLQRFFAVIETAEQPFIPAQGPADFGDEIISAKNVVVRNGVIGRSSHHGVHGNGNENIRFINVDFIDYEVAAIALNGVQGLVVRNSTAINRKDVPVLGTFSSARFIKPYLEHLVNTGSTTTFNGRTATEIRDALRASVNNVHYDLVVDGHMQDGRAQINSSTHPDEYHLFGNPLGVVDGNSYSFLVNQLGVAVNGFPGQSDNPSRNILFQNVTVQDQEAFINEIVTLNQGGGAVNDPVGAVLQVFNRGQDGELITMDSGNNYIGNVIADAQMLVGKAIAAGDFDGSMLDISRNNVTPEVVAWGEGAAFSTIVSSGDDLFCNGDSMFHVNKGVIAYKMDAAVNVLMRNANIDGLVNLGSAGSEECGDYLGGKSHPLATLEGYGGAITRGYSFAGSERVLLTDSQASNLTASAGHAIGVDVLTDSAGIQLRDVEVSGVNAGLAGPANYAGPNEDPDAKAVHVGAEAQRVRARALCAELMVAFDEALVVDDESEMARIHEACN